MTNSTYSRKIRETGETLTIGLCEDLDISNDGEAEYKWATVCESHGTFVLSTTRQLAYGARGADFCDECRARGPVVKVDFTSKAQALAYSEGAKDAYDLLVTILEEGGNINYLLEGIENNARPETVARLNAFYGK